MWLALTDATEENGCPEVAPGCHRHGTLAAPLHRSARVGVPRGGHAVGGGAGGGRRRGGVQLAHAAPHRPQPHRRGPQGLHPPVLPVGRGDPPGRARRRARRSNRVPCTAPERQYEVLRGGDPVARSRARGPRPTTDRRAAGRRRLGGVLHRARRARGGGARRRPTPGGPCPPRRRSGRRCAPWRSPPRSAGASTSVLRSSLSEAGRATWLRPVEHVLDDARRRRGASRRRPPPCGPRRAAPPSGSSSSGGTRSGRARARRAA